MTKIWQSFGATRMIFKFLTEVEGLQLQALNRFWYEIAASRAQLSFVIPDPIYTILWKDDEKENA